MEKVETFSDRLLHGTKVTEIKRTSLLIFTPKTINETNLFVFISVSMIKYIFFPAVRYPLATFSIPFLVRF